MVAPVLQLALAAGVLGGRAFNTRRQNARVNAQASTLTDLLMGGQMGAGGVGPPTPGLAGEISNTERAVLEHLQNTDPQAALAMASRLNEQLRPARAAQQQAAARQAAAFDPLQASNLALQEGRDQYQVFDQQSGGLVDVAAQGSDEYLANVDRLRGVTGILETVNRMQELVSQLEPGAALLDTDDPAAQELAGLARGLVGDVRSAEALGALDAGSVEYIESLLPAGQSLTDLLATSDSLQSALQAGSERFARQLGELQYDMRYYTGLNPELRERISGVEAARAQRAERIAGFARPETSRARPAREAAQRGAEAFTSAVNMAVDRFERGGLSAVLFGGNEPPRQSAVPGTPQTPEDFARQLLEGFMFQNTGRP